MNFPRCSRYARPHKRAGSSPLRLITVSVAFVLVICATLWASESHDGRQIAINFTVVDTRNQPVAQAFVEVRLREQVVVSMLTDATGKGTVTVTAAGYYVLTVGKTAYITSESALEIKPDSGAQDVAVVLYQIALSHQEITVPGGSSNPVAEDASSQATLAPTQAKETPSRPATLTDALPLVPGVVRAKDGTVGIAGYAENHSTLLVNSVDVTDPATGGFGLSVPIDSVETISVSEMPYLAQYGRFIAGVVAAETRRGGEKWSYSLNDPLPEFRIRSAHLEGLKTASPRLNFGGPLLANRLYLSEGTEYLLYKQPVRTLPFPVNETRSEAINSFTQLDAIVSPSQTLTASFHFAPHSLRYAGLDFFNPQPVTPDASVHESTGTILDRLALAGGVLQSTVASTSVNTRVQPQGPAEMFLSPLGNHGNYFSQQSRGGQRFQWIESWSLRTLHFVGDHRMQIGTVLGHSEDEGEQQARPVQIQDAAGHTIQRIDFTGARPFALSDYEPATYMQDHWVPDSRFALDLGVRFEAQTITHTTRTAPRGGFVWTLDQSGKTVVRGGVGVFYDSVPLSVYGFSSYPEQTITSYDSSGAVAGSPLHYVNITQQVAESRFPFVERGQRSGNFAPYSVAWNLELERYVNRLVTIRVKYLQSRAQDLLTLQPEMVHNQNALVLGSSGPARTHQYEITTKIGAEGRRQFFFSYVRQQARGNINDASGYFGDFPFPVVRQNLIASLPNEIPNRFLLWGTYALPRKVQLNAHIEYRNGFPYQATDVLQQYIASSSGPQYRFPRYFAFDLRVSKDFQITKKHAIRISVPMLNITNHFNPLEVHSNIADPRYGTFFGNYPRRILLDFDFLY